MPGTSAHAQMDSATSMQCCVSAPTLACSVSLYSRNGGVQTTRLDIRTLVAYVRLRCSSPSMQRWSPVSGTSDEGCRAASRPRGSSASTLGGCLSNACGPFNAAYGAGFTSDEVKLTSELFALSCFS